MKSKYNIKRRAKYKKPWVLMYVSDQGWVYELTHHRTKYQALIQMYANRLLSGE